MGMVDFVKLTFHNRYAIDVRIKNRGSFTQFTGQRGFFFSQLGKNKEKNIYSLRADQFRGEEYGFVS